MIIGKNVKVNRSFTKRKSISYNKSPTLRTCDIHLKTILPSIDIQICEGRTERYLLSDQLNLVEIELFNCTTKNYKIAFYLTGIQHFAVLVLPTTCINYLQLQDHIEFAITKQIQTLIV